MSNNIELQCPRCGHELVSLDTPNVFLCTHVSCSKIFELDPETNELKGI